MLTVSFFDGRIGLFQPHRIICIQLFHNSSKQTADTSVTNNDITMDSSEDYPLPENHMKIVERRSGKAVGNVELIQIQLSSCIPSSVPDAIIASSDKDWRIQILTKSVHYTEEDLNRIRQIAPGFVNVALDCLKFSTWQPQLLTRYDEEDRLDQQGMRALRST